MPRIYGPKRDETIEEWIKLHNKCHNLYSLLNLFRVVTKNCGWKNLVRIYPSTVWSMILKWIMEIKVVRM
jgi:hypothetical protein